MAINTEAYDFSLFEERKTYTSTVEVLPRKKKSDRTNIVNLPQKELKKNRRARINPIKGFIVTIGFAVAFTTLFVMVFNQVHLTELTDQINANYKVLQQAQSKEVYLEMKASESVDAMELERIAREELGMMKITEGQVVYVNMAGEDKGTVLQITEVSWLDKALNTVKAWFS